MTKPRYKWQPLVRSTVAYRNPKIVEFTAKQYGESIEAAQKRLDDYDKLCEVWINDTYQVQVMRNWDEGWAMLNIRRRDGAPIMRDWRHFQAIKNQLIGEENEAVELYPAESRLVDTSNKYHLYCLLDPTQRFEFGMRMRDVSYDTSNNAIPGLRQRPL